jgi:ABC-type branched-subunit amino acid transport system ATPase component
MTSNDEILTVSNLNVSYGDAKVVFDASLGIKAGQIVACVGRNGAGKTTLLKSIVGFLKPDSGSVMAGNASLVGLKSFNIAKMGIKYVPQDKKVFSDLTVRENLELGSYATKDYNWGPVTDYFPKLTQLMDRKAGYLSGGERQMLMIGRALLGNPQVLLVDEPTEGLSPGIVAQLKSIFKEVSKKTALIIVEQNLPLICSMADKIYAMKEGRIVAEMADKDAITVDICEQYL